MTSTSPTPPAREITVEQQIAYMVAKYVLEPSHVYYGPIISTLRSHDALVAALECATCLHIDAPGREGPDLAPLRALGWKPNIETGQMFVARLARAALRAARGEGK